MAIARRKRTKREQELEEQEKALRAAREKGDKDFEKARKGLGAGEVWSEWDKQDDGSSGRWLPGDRADAETSEQVVQIQTPSGGFVSARGKAIYDNLMKRQEYDRAQEERASKVRSAVAANRSRMEEVRANEASAKLAAKGITAEPRKSDGSFDFDRARGLLSKATFQAWDDDKALAKQAKDLERSNKKELRYWEQAQDGRLGLAAQRDAIQNQDRINTLRNNIRAGEDNPDNLSEAGFWRKAAEADYNAGVRDMQASRNMEEIAKIQSMSAQELSDKFKVSLPRIQELMEGGLTPEEIDLLEDALA